MENTRWVHAFKETPERVNTKRHNRACDSDAHRGAITLVVEKLLTALERDAVGGSLDGILFIDSA